MSENQIQTIREDWEPYEDIDYGADASTDDRAPPLDPNERFTLWDDETELNDLLRRVVFRAVKPYWLSSNDLAEHFNDLYQTAWAKLLELRVTDYDAYKGSIIARIRFTVSRYLETQIFGWQPLGGDNCQKYRLIRFYQFMPGSYCREFDDEELDQIMCQLTDAQVMEIPTNPEDICCESSNWHTVFDQWKPTLEEDLFITISASRLHRSPQNKLRPETIRRHAFMLTARLRGMRNVEIALQTGRHSDRRKARLRVGADISSAREAINTWLSLDEIQREEALSNLYQQYPTISEEPFAYSTLDRELLWGCIQNG